MPASYAHYRFGKQIVSGLSGEERQTIRRFRRLFDMGLHGPDIFFYHNPFMKTAAGDLGRLFHCQSGQEFFSRVCAQAGSEAANAYLYGLLAHYCLDSACHPFVHKMVEQGAAGHVALESEFDRYLMELDGFASPQTRDISRHMKLTRGECMTVAGFYPPATGAQVHMSVFSMARSTRFLSGSHSRWMETLLEKFKPGILDHRIPGKAVAEYARMDSELLARFNRSVKQYPAMLIQLKQHMKTGEPLGEDFAPDFG